MLDPDMEGSIIGSIYEIIRGRVRVAILDITISDLLERAATQEQRERKIDIADLVVEEKMEI